MEQPPARARPHTLYACSHRACVCTPASPAGLRKLNIHHPDGEPIADLQLEANATFVRMHAPRLPLASQALAFVHSFEVMHVERLVCPTRPWLCQGFNRFHVDDTHLIPKLYNRLLLIIEKDGRGGSSANLRVVPRGAMRRWRESAAEALRKRPAWQRTLLRTALRTVWAWHERLLRPLGASGAVSRSTQLAHALAGCTARTVAGDVLVMAWDVSHQTQGASSDRLLLVASSCANCDASNEIHGDDDGGDGDSDSEDDATRAAMKEWQVSAGVIMAHQEGRELARLLRGADPWSSAHPVAAKPPPVPRNRKAKGQATRARWDSGSALSSSTVSGPDAITEPAPVNGPDLDPGAGSRDVLCEPFCVEACARLDGNVGYECGGCTSDAFACRPGAPGFVADVFMRPTT